MDQLTTIFAIFAVAWIVINLPDLHGREILWPIRFVTGVIAVILIVYAMLYKV